MDAYDDEQHLTNRCNYNQKEKQKIIEWLTLLKVALPANFNLDAKVLSEFKDG